MRRGLLFLIAAGLSAAAGYDPVEVLHRAIQQAVARSKAIPKYTCVETVTREYYEPAVANLPRDCEVLLEQRRNRTPDLVLQPYSTDRLRLDVTMSSEGEIFSWPGASRFDDREIDQVVRVGPMGTGSFGGFLGTIFSTDVRKFVYERSVIEDGRSVMEYSFQVEQPDSHYRMKVNTSWIFVAYQGTFRVAPESGDVVSMTITTGESPRGAGVCQVTTNLDFAKVQIGSEQFMLPRQTRQRFIYPQVEETENTTVFSNCREFRGDSSVTFSPEEPAKVGVPKAAAVAPLVIPRGLAFSLTLTAPIPTDTAAAGDRFTARLADALRDYQNKLLAPKGSIVEGRILRIQTFAKSPEAIVVLKPELIRTRSGSLALNAARDWTYLIAQSRRRRKPIEILVPLRGEDNSGVFRFPGDHVTVPANFRSDWKTTNP